MARSETTLQLVVTHPKRLMLVALFDRAATAIGWRGGHVWAMRAVDHCIAVVRVA